MEIAIVSGAGSGPTEMAAFHAALESAGLGRYNIIGLSSVIPSGASVCVHETLLPVGSAGDRLYAVVSRGFAVEPGQCVVAGLGWTVSATTGEGLFAEYVGASESDVERSIVLSLNSMMSKQSIEFGGVSTQLATVTCHGAPACAVVAAAYAVLGWGDAVTLT